MITKLLKNTFNCLCKKKKTYKGKYINICKRCNKKYLERIDNQKHILWHDYCSKCIVAMVRQKNKKS